MNRNALKDKQSLAICIIRTAGMDCIVPINFSYLCYFLKVPLSVPRWLKQSLTLIREHSLHSSLVFAANRSKQPPQQPLSITMKKTKALFGKLSGRPRARGGQISSPSPPARLTNTQELSSPAVSPSIALVMIEDMGTETVPYLQDTSSSSTPQAITPASSRSVDHIDEIQPNSEQASLIRPNEPATLLSASSRESTPTSSQSEPTEMEVPPFTPMKSISSATCEARSATELEKAIDEFKVNYQHFAQQNKQYIILEDALDGAFQKPHATLNLRDTAEMIRQKLRTTMNTSQTKKESHDKWTSKIGQFVTKLYPVAKLASGHTASVAEVCSSSGLP